MISIDEGRQPRLKTLDGGANVDRQALQQATGRVRAHFGSIPNTAVILGSGLGAFGAALREVQTLPSHRIPGYPASTVAGHRGRWLVGKAGERPVLVVQGRIHAYEGYSFQQVAFPVHLLAELGVRYLVITNAAGAINRFYAPGDFMVIADHINLTFGNPLLGRNDARLGPRFPDMVKAYDPALMALALECGQELSLRLHQGVYLGVAGPSYETAAEIRMAERLGADAVGMSTVPEVIAAAYRRLRVLGLSCISNLATGISQQKLSHAEVTEVGRRVADDFKRLLYLILQKMLPE